MAVKDQSILDDYSYAPPIVVAESIRSNGETTPDQTSPVQAPPLPQRQHQQQQQRQQSYMDEQPPTENTRIDITRLVPEDQKHLVGPAGLGGAVLGFIFGGPILSALLGFGSAYAVRKENGAGDAARALGEMTMSVQQKAAEIEDRHRYYGRSVDAINRQCEKSQHSLAFKTREFVRSTWHAVGDYTRKHQLIERGVEGTGKGVEYVACAFTSKRNDTSSDDVHREKSDDGYEYTKVADSEPKK
jgi:hypothetical protein